MSQIIVNDLKRGVAFQKDGVPYMVVDITMHTPSARGANMLVKIKARSLLTSNVQDMTFKGGDMVDEPDFERKQGQFLYQNGEEFVFMDLNTYEQYTLNEEQIGDRRPFLMEGLEIVLHIFNGNLVNIELPLVVEQRIVECEPVIKGGTAAAQPKTAVTETGIVIQVPSYMKEGELIKIDTRQKRYISRA
ncbi:elongation factor P [bacterium]|nr:elongation factor P [bacterium]